MLGFASPPAAFAFSRFAGAFDFEPAGVRLFREAGFAFLLLVTLATAASSPRL
jgi:hypothetical protein